MKDVGFEKTLNYCLYVCCDEAILLELKILSSKYFSGLSEEKDYNRVFEIEKILFKNI